MGLDTYHNADLPTQTWSWRPVQDKQGAFDFSAIVPHDKARLVQTQALSALLHKEGSVGCPPPQSWQHFYESARSWFFSLVMGVWSRQPEDTDFTLYPKFRLITRLTSGRSLYGSQIGCFMVFTGPDLYVWGPNPFVQTVQIEPEKVDNLSGRSPMLDEIGLYISDVKYVKQIMDI